MQEKNYVDTFFISLHEFSLIYCTKLISDLHIIRSFLCDSWLTGIYTHYLVARDCRPQHQWSLKYAANLLTHFPLDWASGVTSHTAQYLLPMEAASRRVICDAIVSQILAIHAETCHNNTKKCYMRLFNYLRQYRLFAILYRMYVWT